MVKIISFLDTSLMESQVGGRGHHRLRWGDDGKMWEKMGNPVDENILEE
ncbi:hypothetical protein PB2503_08904 [Parvularcula bermudensis HTCC2503]|uniref:Uncharacterized protein n=1 Tax=Parvularcula bermudensis (strain ATCC BAA-594 / HTCC2503 / KCTC 12087) TaxID=314260 RepID=E0TCE4_PARBH|nr:hypothetical protein PB2503_08904 [Parvularcula bermudensis HTCC2503]